MPNSDLSPESIAYFNQVQQGVNSPTFQQAAKMGVPITPDLLQKLAVQASKPLPLSQGIVTMDAPTGGKLNVDAATREIIPPGNIVQPAKPLPGSRGTAQDQLPDGSYIIRDLATGEKVTGERPPVPTEAQGNAMMYSNRMKQNEKTISGISNEHYDPTAINAPLPNRLQSEARQKYESAASNWISATLRKESGAAISDTEYANGFKQYFPLPGDKPGVVEQKAQLRAKVAADMHSLSGPYLAQESGHGPGISGGPAQAAGTRTLQPDDVSALNWANANLNDPRAGAIKQRLGIR
tara:strand:+ start:335 stop:1219 length:885 start_codon:yes stop_codon:yes gene_type:complete